MNPEDEGKTELFVRNISRNVREEGLRKFFGEFGPLTKCKYFFGKQVAFIEYGTPQESAKAQAATNGTDLEGQTLEVEFSGDKPAPKAPTQDAASTTVFCGNLGFRTDESIIRGFFEQCGPVAQVRIAKDPETDRAKGFCHVEFESPADAAKAVESLNG